MISELDKLKHAHLHIKCAADYIVKFAEKNPEKMCGWLSDACVSADIAAADLKSIIETKVKDERQMEKQY